MEKHRKAQNVVIGVTFFFAMLVLLHVSGIGCPIRFATGVSCPGCGMTRAWLSVLALRLDLALAYHPLFWMVPALLLLLALRNRMGKRTFSALCGVALAALVAVWAVRLACPKEANVLFSGLLPEEVVSVGTPPWVEFLGSHFVG